MHVGTIDENGGHQIEKDKGGVYGKILREKRTGEIMQLYSKK